jgi:multimeric flavodoxin WrbA
MNEIITALQNNDILVLCSPVYYLGFSAQLKTLIDRTYAESAIGRKIQNTILLSVAGKQDEFVSDCMINTYKQLCDYLGFQDLGIIFAKGFENPNDIEDSQILIDAFELGKSID